MKIAIATKEGWGQVSGHAGKVREWLVYDCQPDTPLGPPSQVHLNDAQLPHNFKGDGPHPLRGVALMVAGSAGDGYVRHMKEWGAEVVITGESVPLVAIEKILEGQALQDPRFDITTALCKVRDLFSRH